MSLLHTVDDDTPLSSNCLPRCCWQCCNKKISLRSDSILSRRKLTYRPFIDLLYEFSRGSSISEAAAAVGLSNPTVRSLFNEIRERMAEEIATTLKIGGPGRIVEIDEAKFGKRKYQRGRIVRGSWVLGGVERHSNKCFLAICPFNRRSEAALLPIIQHYVAPGTTVITDRWKAYVNLQNHGSLDLEPHPLQSPSLPLDLHDPATVLQAVKPVWTCTTL